MLGCIDLSKLKIGNKGLIVPSCSRKKCSNNCFFFLFKSSFTVLAEVNMWWQHPCVKWGNDPETGQWNKITRLSVTPDWIWLPVIQHSNAYDELYDIFL